MKIPSCCNSARSLEDLEAMTRHLEAHGVTVLARAVAGSYGVFTNFLDPDGNKLEVLFQDEAYHRT